MRSNNDKAKKIIFNLNEHNQSVNNRENDAKTRKEFKDFLNELDIFYFE